MGDRAAFRWVVALLVAVLAGCTGGGEGEPRPSPTPSPSPTPTAPPITGPRIAVVRTSVPVGGSLSTDREAVDRIRTAFGDRVSEVRDVVPEPDSFFPDVVSLLADQGYDLVCGVGSGALDAVLAAAPDHPTVRFCAFPGVVEDPPENVLVLDLAVEELGFVAGAVARELAPQAPPGLVASRGIYGPDRVQAGFRAGAASRAPQGEEVPDVLIGVPADDAEAARSFASSQFDAGANVLFAAAGDANEGVLSEAADQNRAVIGPVPVASEDGQTPPPSVIVLGLETHLQPALRLAVERLLDAWSNEPVSLGFAAGGFRAVEGVHPRAAAAMRIAGQVRDAIEAGEEAVPGRR